MSLRDWLGLRDERCRERGYRQGFADAMRSAAVEARSAGASALGGRLDAKADAMEQV